MMSNNKNRLANFIRSKLFVSLGIFFFAVYLMTLAIQKRQAEYREEEIWNSSIVSDLQASYSDMAGVLSAYQRMVPEEASSLTIAEPLQELLESVEFELFLSEQPKDVEEIKTKYFLLDVVESFGQWVQRKETASSKAFAELDLREGVFLLYRDIHLATKEKDLQLVLGSLQIFVEKMKSGEFEVPSFWFSYYALEYLSLREQFEAKVSLARNAFPVSPHAIQSFFQNIRFLPLFCDRLPDVTEWVLKAPILFCDRKVEYMQYQRALGLLQEYGQSGVGEKLQCSKEIAQAMRSCLEALSEKEDLASWEKSLELMPVSGDWDLSSKYTNRGQIYNWLIHSLNSSL